MKNPNTRRLLYILTLQALLAIFVFNLSSISSASAERRTTITQTKTVKKSTRRRTRKSSRRTRSARRKAVTRTSARHTDRAIIAGRSRRSSSGGYRSSRRRRTVVHHRPIHRGSSATSSQSGFMPDVLIEVGGAHFTPVEGEGYSGLQLAIGSRMGPVAGVIEAQMRQGFDGAELRDLNAQLRVYLPIGANAELFPLLGVGQSDLASVQSASHFDLGLGAQFKLSRHFAIGGRYSARVIADRVDGTPSNGHNLLAHMSISF